MLCSTADLKRMCGAYQRLLDGADILYPNMKFAPWYFLCDGQIYDFRARWRCSPDQPPLIAFAQRQDCDDTACFEIRDGRIGKVILMQGWAIRTCRIVDEYPTFEDWLASTKDDGPDAKAIADLFGYAVYEGRV